MFPLAKAQFSLCSSSSAAIVNNTLDLQYRCQKLFENYIEDIADSYKEWLHRIENIIKTKEFQKNTPQRKKNIRIFRQLILSETLRVLSEIRKIESIGDKMLLNSWNSSEEMFRGMFLTKEVMIPSSSSERRKQKIFFDSLEYFIGLTKVKYTASVAAVHTSVLKDMNRVLSTII